MYELNINPSMTDAAIEVLDGNDGMVDEFALLHDEYDRLDYNEDEDDGLEEQDDPNAEKVANGSCMPSDENQGGKDTGTQAGKWYMTGNPKNRKRSRVDVKSIPPTMSDKQLTKLFTIVGPVKRVHIARHRVSLLSYGHGFVDFQKEDDALKAAEKFDGFETQQRKLQVAYSYRNTSHDLFIGNLGPTTSQQQIRKLFSNAGRLLRCDVVIERKTGRCLGKAYAIYAKEEEALKAIEMFNEKPNLGRDKLLVRYARAKEETGLVRLMTNPAKIKSRERKLDRLAELQQEALQFAQKFPHLPNPSAELLNYATHEIKIKPGQGILLNSSGRPIATPLLSAMPPAIKPPWHDLEFRRAATLMGHLRTKPKRKADYKKQIELVQNLKKAKRIAFYNRMKLKTGISEEELEDNSVVESGGDSGTPELKKKKLGDDDKTINDAMEKVDKFMTSIDRRMRKLLREQSGNNTPKAGTNLQNNQIGKLINSSNAPMMGSNRPTIGLNGVQPTMFPNRHPMMNFNRPSMIRPTGFMTGPSGSMIRSNIPNLSNQVHRPPMMGLNLFPRGNGLLPLPNMRNVVPNKNTGNHYNSQLMHYHR